MNEIDKYIASFPPEVQERMNQLRALILEIAPEAEEIMAYAMPAYKTNRKPLVYFAGYKNHIGFYATPTGHEQFKAELSAYKQGRGSVQFPLNKPLPLELIREMILFKFNEIRTDNQ
jgi:uncharacterized protein YdhG (YjbR/CyaY superfamily)